MTKYIIGAVAALVLAVGGFFLGAHQPAPAVSSDQKAGSVTSNDLQGNEWSVAGLVQYEYHVAMRANASTTCSVISPNATSSLSFSAQKISSSTSAANILELGTDPTSGYATTTLIGGTMHIAAAATFSSVGSSTNSTGLANIIAPNTRVNVKVGAWAAAAPVGFCDYKFNVL